jgi:hypothetical protein
VDELSTGSESDYANSWITWFLSTKGNEYFCEVDEEYILDRFNLTGLNSEVLRYGMALDLITDAFGALFLTNLLPFLFLKHVRADIHLFLCIFIARIFIRCG